MNADTKTMAGGAVALGAVCGLGYLFLTRDKQRHGQTKPDSEGQIAANRKKVKRMPVESFPKTEHDLLLRVAKGEKTERAPVWMMRQAGRYLREFREIRTTADFHAMCQDPELACEVTLQPLERFPLDAVIVFSDILVIPMAMGLGVKMVPGRGPVFPEPLRKPQDLERLNFQPNIEDTLGYVFDVVNLVRQKVTSGPRNVPVLGFTGAPFTLMGYMIEGGGSKTLSKVKSWLHNHPAAAHRLLQGITDILVQYCVGKVRAGAQLIQVFESNAGDLGPGKLFYEFSFAYIKQIGERLKSELKKQGLPVVPLTVFCRGANSEGILESLANDTVYDVIGIDWQISAKEAKRRVGDKKVLQGNLDPCTLYASPEKIRSEVKEMLEGFGVNGHIANLGHGMLPDHNPEHARAFINAVQELSAEMRK